MRHQLIFVLCLLLPLQGFAGWQVPASPCSMLHAPCSMLGMMDMADESGEMAESLVEAMEDCCNDMATFKRTGQPCKSDQSGVAPAAGLPSFPSLASQTPVTQDPLAPAWHSVPPGATTRLWRPPTSV